MANTEKIFEFLKNENLLNNSKINFWALVPNEKGLERALNSNCKAIALFTGASSTFTQKNIGMTIDESLNVFQSILKKAKKLKLKTRVYISTVWGCPYEGKINKKIPIEMTKNLLKMGAEQISLGDTIGIATPNDVYELLIGLKDKIKKNKIAVHFHDTRGTALSNALIALQLGVKTFDTSSGGLGGCNFVPNASGNLATEDLLYMLNGYKIQHGVDLLKLCEASKYIIQELKKIPTSKFLQAYLNQNSSFKISL
jgi:hydroxymethylglutaryl-CoA lyase